jgi:UDP-N-acetylglucosamine 2-epimerase (non-hydrolysing)
MFALLENCLNIFHIVGARPNFMKVAPVLNALKGRKNMVQTLVHTGQHYDVNMSEVFFRQLGMPAPDVYLAVGSGTHAKQTAEIMIRLEPVVVERQPDIVLVYGDVNSTVAAALVCAKLGVRVGHIEAGLRSFDRTMPEEINRLVTDQLADWLFTPSEDGDENLRREGIPPEKVFCVGNVMIDSLVRLLPSAENTGIDGLPERYALVTLHRPANVDDSVTLKGILESLVEVNRDLTVVFPAHPRTRKRIADFGLTAGQLCVLDPLSRCALPDPAREHRTSSHSHSRNQRSRRTRSRQTALRTIPSPRRPGQEGNYPSSLGRSRGRTNRRHTR